MHLEVVASSGVANAALACWIGVMTGTPPPDSPTGGIDPFHVSRYVADMTAELSKMTEYAQLKMLSYLLGMVRQEAERIARAAPGQK